MTTSNHQSHLLGAEALERIENVLRSSEKVVSDVCIELGIADAVSMSFEQQIDALVTQGSHEGAFGSNENRTRARQAVKDLIRRIIGSQKLGYARMGGYPELASDVLTNTMLAEMLEIATLSNLSLTLGTIKRVESRGSKHFTQDNFGNGDFEYIGRLSKRAHAYLVQLVSPVE